LLVAGGLVVAGVDGLPAETLPEVLAGAVLVAVAVAGESFEPEVHPATSAASSAHVAAAVLLTGQG
jgi:hypothetical protein